MTTPSSSSDQHDLPPCCERELHENRQYNETVAILRQHDRVALAERRRRNLLPENSLSFGTGCRCCYDPQLDGGDYDALIQARKMKKIGTKMESTNNLMDLYENDPRDGAHSNNHHDDDDDDDDSDSDSEFDYLLDEFELSSNITSGNSSNAQNVYELSEMEYQRRLELELSILENEGIQQHGYGVHRQMNPKRVLKAAGFGYDRNASIPPPTAVVLHLYNPLSSASAKMDLILEDISSNYRGTKFLRSHGPLTLLLDPTMSQKHLCLSSSTKPIQEKHMPCLIAIKDGCIVNVAPLYSGFVTGEVGKTDQDDDIFVNDHAVEEWLDRSGSLISNPPKYEMLCRIRPEEESLLFLQQQQLEKGMKTMQINGPPGGNMFCGYIKEEEEKEQQYDCGVAGCRRRHFYHKHVGVASEAQDGLVVSQNEILSS